jgi:hypothetical protein
MAAASATSTWDHSLRFFSPEQIDQILREGIRRGRAGSHYAIERILRHETGLRRTDLWRRIRQLKEPLPQTRYQRHVWSPEDDQILRQGYESDWPGKQGAVRHLLKRHPNWRPHVIWRRAAKLRLVRKAPKRRQERSGLRWSEEDDRILLNLGGYKTTRCIGKILHRSEAAVRNRLMALGESSRVHLEGYAQHALAKDLHLGKDTIQRLIVDGLLEVRDPRITRESLDRLLKSGILGEEQKGIAQESETLILTPGLQDNASEVSEPVSSAGLSGPRAKPSRGKRVWAEVANSLGVPVETVERLIARRVLKLYDPRITEKSLRDFCRRYGSMINYDFLNRETKEWLQTTMDFVRGSGESASRALACRRKHARIVRQCSKCGHPIRGNVYFRHIRKCRAKVSESVVNQGVVRRPI